MTHGNLVYVQSLFAVFFTCTSLVSCRCRAKVPTFDMKQNYLTVACLADTVFKYGNFDLFCFVL